MRDPNMMNHVTDTFSEGGKTILDIQNVPKFDKELYDFFNEKDFKSYMKDIERTVRTSFEYRYAIGYLRMDEGMDVCSVYENVTSRDNPKVRIEIHHSPFTLYDICNTVFNKRQANREDLRVEAVAEEVVYLHYIGWTGLIPLSKTVHELVHNQYYFVPNSKVRGNYHAFLREYYNYIDPETLDCFDATEQATKEYMTKFANQNAILNRHDIYINADNSYELPKLDEMSAMLKSRIARIKNETVTMARIVKKQ